MMLYTRNAKGSLMFWDIISCPEDWLLIIEYGVWGSDARTRHVTVTENQSGRTIEEQCQLEMEQRISRKKQQGYTEDIPNEGKKIVNALGLPKPMLAQKYTGQTIDTGPNTIYTQPKLDGNRCIIKLGADGSVVPYTRNGKEITTLSHITDELDGIIKNSSFPVDTFIDGELYCHGESLQTIVSWVKREQKDTKRIKFMCYDVMKSHEYQPRLHWIKVFLSGYKTIEVVETMEHNYMDKQVAEDLMMGYREQGYEGAIIRHGESGYEDGKRSKSLLKVKHWLDDEFEIIDIDGTNDAHGIFVCRINDKSFKCNPPGDFAFRIHVYDNPKEFIGKFVTVEYANLTKDGIPFHPVAKCMVKDKEV